MNRDSTGEPKLFTCLLCKKVKNHSHLNLLFDDGSPMCNECANEIRNSFSYYIGEKRVDKQEFDERTGNL